MRDQGAFVLWEQALRYVRERHVDGVTGMFVLDGVVELPFPLPGMPRAAEEREELRRVLAPVWRAQKDARRRIDRGDAVPTIPDPELLVLEFELHGVEASGAPYRLSYVHVVTARDAVDAGAIRERVHTTELERHKAVVRRHFEARIEQLALESPGATLTVDTLVAERDLVSARSTQTRTIDGEKIVSSGMAFFRVADGKIVEKWTCDPGVGA